MNWFNYIEEFFARHHVSTTNPISANSRTSDLSFFWFLVDAPMAMDTSLIERFHDAVIRPESILTSTSEVEASKDGKERRLGAAGKGSGEVPFVVKLAINGTFDHRTMHEDSNTRTQQLAIPRTPERLLEEIVAFYLSNFPKRVLRVDPVNMKVYTGDSDTEQCHEILDKTCEEPGPRPIVLIDAPKHTKIMPMAGEFVNGKLDVMYESLIQALSTQDAPLLPIATDLSPEVKTQRWKELVERFDSSTGRSVVEKSARRNDNSRFDWVDFRMAWGNGGFPSPLHLHVVPNGRYPTGVFGHAFVRRGYSNGVRIVGTLKTGGDINVLAIFER